MLLAKATTLPLPPLISVPWLLKGRFSAILPRLTSPVLFTGLVYSVKSVLV